MTKQNQVCHSNQVRETLFDSDSVSLVVDNGASASITTTATKFHQPPETSQEWSQQKIRKYGRSHERNSKMEVRRQCN